MASPRFQPRDSSDTIGSGSEVDVVVARTGDEKGKEEEFYEFLGSASNAGRTSLPGATEDASPVAIAYGGPGVGEMAMNTPFAAGSPIATDFPVDGMYMQGDGMMPVMWATPQNGEGMMVDGEEGEEEVIEGADSLDSELDADDRDVRGVEVATDFFRKRLDSDVLSYDTESSEVRCLDYTPATNRRPIDFRSPVRVLRDKRRIRVLVNVTVYNEESADMEGTLRGIAENLFQLRALDVEGVPSFEEMEEYKRQERTLIKRWVREYKETRRLPRALAVHLPPGSDTKKGGLSDTVLLAAATEAAAEELGPPQTARRGVRWDEVAVVIVIDGRQKMSPSMEDYLEKELRLYDKEMMLAEHEGDPVTCHIFERNVQLPRSRAQREYYHPLQVILAVKENNGGKLNSHLWFCSAFARQMQPEFVVFFDVGTIPEPHAVSKLIEAMIENEQLGGCAGEIATRDVSLFDAVAASQKFEYMVSHFLDKASESIWGYISVLPGAFSAYRWEALRGEPLNQYFKLEETSAADLGPFVANMYLAEDRILCFEIVAKRRSNYTLHYVNSAVATTDIPTSLSVLIRQRRRWLNGSLLALVYYLLNFPKLLQKSDHSFGRRVALTVQFLYNITYILLIWFSIGSLYLGLVVIYSNAAAQVDNAFDSIQLVFDCAYFILTVALLVLSLGSNISHVDRLYFTAFLGYGLLFYFAIVLSAWHLSTGRLPLIVLFAAVATFGGYALLAFFHGKLGPFLVTIAQYYFALPTYLNLFPMYSFANLHDVSWGNREGSLQKQLVYVERKKKRAEEQAALEDDDRDSRSISTEESEFSQDSSQFDNLNMDTGAGVHPTQQSPVQPWSKEVGALAPSVQQQNFNKDEEQGNMKKAETSASTSTHEDNDHNQGSSSFETDTDEEDEEDEDEDGGSHQKESSLSSGENASSSSSSSKEEDEQSKHPSEVSADTEVEGLAEKIVAEAAAAAEDERVKKQEAANKARFDADMERMKAEFSSFRTRALVFWLGTNWIYVSVILVYGLLNGFAVAMAWIVFYSLAIRGMGSMWYQLERLIKWAWKRTCGRMCPGCAFWERSAMGDRRRMEKDRKNKSRKDRLARLAMLQDDQLADNDDDYMSVGSEMRREREEWGGDDFADWRFWMDAKDEDFGLAPLEEDVLGPYRADNGLFDQPPPPESSMEYAYQSPFSPEAMMMMKDDFGGSRPPEMTSDAVDLRMVMQRGQNIHESIINKQGMDGGEVGGESEDLIDLSELARRGEQANEGIRRKAQIEDETTEQQQQQQQDQEDDVIDLSELARRGHTTATGIRRKAQVHDDDDRAASAAHSLRMPLRHDQHDDDDDDDDDDVVDLHALAEAAAQATAAVQRKAGSNSSDEESSNHLSSHGTAEDLQELINHGERLASGVAGKAKRSNSSNSSSFHTDENFA